MGNQLEGRLVSRRASLQGSHQANHPSTLLVSHLVSHQGNRVASLVVYPQQSQVQSLPVFRRLYRQEFLVQNHHRIQVATLQATLQESQHHCLLVFPLLFLRQSLIPIQQDSRLVDHPGNLLGSRLANLLRDRQANRQQSRVVNPVASLHQDLRVIRQASLLASHLSNLQVDPANNRAHSHRRYHPGSLLDNPLICLLGNPLGSLVISLADSLRFSHQQSLLGGQVGNHLENLVVALLYALHMRLAAQIPLLRIILFAVFRPVKMM